MKKIKEAFTNLSTETSERQSVDASLQSALSVAGPDCLVAGSMTDLYEKLNTSSWWLNGHTISGKALIRQIRVFNWFFTLVVTRSEVLTQYLFGPVILRADNTFDVAAYFESYILKRVLFPDGSGSNNKWHYVDRSDFLNVDEYKPLQDGFYTAATARGAVVSSLRKGGLVITYRTGENTWTVEQAKGASNWTDGSNWTSTGSGSGGSGGSGTDLSDIEDSIANMSGDIYVLKRNAFRYLATGTGLDTVTTPGAYYRGTEEKAPEGDGIPVPLTVSKEFIFVTGTKNLISDSDVHDVTQYLVNSSGISMRKHYSGTNIIGGEPAHWGGWTLYGSGIEEAPQDGKLYVRRNGAWVEVSGQAVSEITLSVESLSFDAAGN
ncbi:MAG: hypothetical protein LBK22_04325 [Tannerella sp.]|nr:hypothetical protein [Tannerella sp.]